MATIYTIDGDIITEGLQGRAQCDEALQLARRIAAERDEAVELHDDGSAWRVEPDGSTSEAGYLVEGRGEVGEGESGRWSREYVEAGGSAAFATLEAAEAAIDDLIETCGFKRHNLRARAL
jgi:hypothetical protein